MDKQSVLEFNTVLQNNRGFGRIGVSSKQGEQMATLKNHQIIETIEFNWKGTDYRLARTARGKYLQNTKLSSGWSGWKMDINGDIFMESAKKFTSWKTI